MKASYIILIVHDGDVDRTSSTVLSAAQSTTEPLFVVTNGAPASAFQKLTHLQSVQFLETPEMGLVNALNAGIRKAEGQDVIRLDAGTEPLGKNWAGKLHELAGEHESIGALA